LLYFAYMFTAPPSVHRKAGIELITGSMFSGKTEELIRRLREARAAGSCVKIFKPGLDTRYHQSRIVSHDSNAEDCMPLSSSSLLAEAAAGADVICIDEVQFFDTGIVEVCSSLAQQDKRIILAGLDLDYLARPFGPVPLLAAIAHQITRLQAVCVVCKRHAEFTFRTDASGGQVLLGEKDRYEARCRSCYLDGMKGRDQKSVLSET
jgi:thymidine kinase